MVDTKPIGGLPLVNSMQHGPKQNLWQTTCGCIHQVLMQAIYKSTKSKWKRGGGYIAHNLTSKLQPCRQLFTPTH